MSNLAGEKPVADAPSKQEAKAVQKVAQIIIPTATERLKNSD